MIAASGSVIPDVIALIELLMMGKFKPQTSAKPAGFDKASLATNSLRIGQRVNQIAHELDYWYLATHHLMYALLEHDFASGDGMFAGFDIPILEYERAMLAADPPGESAILFKLPTSVHVWDCYMHAITVSKSESRLASPDDILDGLLKHRQVVVDSILAEFGIAIEKSAMVARASVD